MPHTDPSTASTTRRGPIGIFLLGLRLLSSELSWQGLKVLRAWERRQLQKRLREERLLLGEAVEADLSGRLPEFALGRKTELPPLGEDAILALKQVHFLQQEIEHLSEERRDMREQFETRRRQKLGLAGQ